MAYERRNLPVTLWKEEQCSIVQTNALLFSGSVVGTVSLTDVVRIIKLWITDDQYVISLQIHCSIYEILGLSLSPGMRTLIACYIL